MRLYTEFEKPRKLFERPFSSRLLSANGANELFRLQPSIDTTEAETMGALDGRGMDQPVLRVQSNLESGLKFQEIT